MNSRDFRNLTEAYNNIYSQEEETFFFKEDIDLLSDSDIDEAVEEAIDELLDEGFTLEEIDQAFDDFDDSFIVEARRATRSNNPEDPEKVKANIYAKDDEKDAKKPLSKKAQKQKEMKAERLAAKASEDNTRSAREAASKAPKTSSTGSSNVVKRSGDDMNSRYVRGSSGSSSSNTKTSAKSNTKTSAKVTTSGTPVRAKVTTNNTDSPAKKVSGSVKKAIAHKTTDADHSDAVRRSRSASLGKTLTSKPSSSSSSSSSSPSSSSSSSGSSSSFGYKTKTGERVDKFAHKVKKIRDKVASSISKKNVKSLGKKVLSVPGRAIGVVNAARKKQERKEMRPQVTMSNSYDAYDIMLDFIVENGVAESYEEAEWLMANVFDADDVKMVLETEE